MTHRILVIANETVEGRVLHDTVLARAGEADSAEVLVICPALNSRLKHWISDEDGARAAAQAPLQTCLHRLAGEGGRGEGFVGDAGPVQAIQDVRHAFDPDRI